MPLPPPVIRMVLPVIFISGSFGVRIHAGAQLWSILSFRK